MNDRNKVLEQIRNLQLKADDPASFEAEVDVFAEKAAKLMAKHLVTEAELEEYSSRKVNPNGYPFDIPSLNTWRLHLINSCASLFGCRVIYRKMGDQRVLIVGKKISADAVGEIFKRIERDVIRTCRIMYPGDVNSARRAEKGMGIGISLRLIQMRKTNSDFMLPVVNELANIDNFLEGKVHHEEPTDPSDLIDSEEALIGFISADRIKVNGEIL